MAKKKKKFNTAWLVGGFIIFFMVTSGFGVMFGSYANNPNKIRYNDITFSQIETGKYRAKINDKMMEFDYAPTHVESIEMDPVLVERFRNAAEIDMTYDYDSDAAQEIAVAIFEMKSGHLKDVYIREGSIKENEYNHSIITCMDSSTTVPVIYFSLGNETAFTLQGNCIWAQAQRAEEFGALRDRLVFSILGVMD